MPRKRKKVMNKAQKAILRSRSGAAVTQAELARLKKAVKSSKFLGKKVKATSAGVLGGFAGAKAGASIGKLHKGKVAKMLGATFGGGGLAGVKRGKAAAKKRNKALKRRK